MKTIFIPLLFCLFDGNVLPVVFDFHGSKTTGFTVNAPPAKSVQLSFVRTDVRHGQRLP